MDKNLEMSQYETTSEFIKKKTNFHIDVSLGLKGERKMLWKKVVYTPK